MFVSSATLLCVYVFSMSAFYINIIMEHQRGTVWMAMRESPWAVALMIYCFIALWFVGGLTGFHSYLIGTNQVSFTCNHCYHLLLLSYANCESTYSKCCANFADNV